MQPSFSDLVSKAFLGNPGILFEILLHFWIKIGGIDLEWIRLLPLIFSSIGIFFLYKIANFFGGLFTALTAVSMYAFSTFMHYYGFELRGYSLYAMLALASTWFLFQYLKEQNTSKKTTLHYWLWGFFSLCLVYTHWFSWFFAGFQFFLTFCYFKQQRTKIAILFALVLIGFVPAAIKLFDWFVNLTSQGTFLTPPKWDGFYYVLSDFFNRTLGFSMIALFICFVAFILAIKQKEKKFQLLCLSIGLPFALMFLISFKYPMWVSRYVIFACAGFILIFVISLIKIFDSLKKQQLKRVWLVFSVCFLGYYFFSFSSNYKFFWFFDYSGAVEFVKKHKKKPFVLVDTSWDLALMYRYHRPILYKVAAGGSPSGKYDDFYYIQLTESSGLQAIREANCDQVIVFGNRFDDPQIVPLLDSLSVLYPVQEQEIPFFSPFFHVKIFQKK
jgi:hypothetical protein